MRRKRRVQPVSYTEEERPGDGIKAKRLLLQMFHHPNDEVDKPSVPSVPDVACSSESF